MAKANLATNFKDDILNSSMGNKRRYNLIQNDDGTVSLEDVSAYDQVGSEYGAGQVNATNKAVNESADAGKIIDDVDDINAVTEEGYIAGALALKNVNSSLGGLQFGVDADGNYGYIKAGADSVTPFKSGGCEMLAYKLIGAYNGIFDTTYKITVPKAISKGYFAAFGARVNLIPTLAVSTSSGSVTQYSYKAGGEISMPTCILCILTNIPKNATITFTMDVWFHNGGYILIG